MVVVFLFTKPAVTLLARTKFFSGGNKWSGLDPERLGAQAKWRSSTRRTSRSERSRPGSRSSYSTRSGSGSTPGSGTRGDL